MILSIGRISEGVRSLQQSNLSRIFSSQYSPRLEIIFTGLQAINELSGNSYSLKDIDTKGAVE